nr:GNAT family N-acetyltransferase [Sulfitobacter algicola]
MHATVNAGAAVSFLWPHTIDDARAFWRDQIFPNVRNGDVILWGAVSGGKVTGTVQLQIALPQNQPHRCEVAKLLVHPDYRKRGIAGQLMAALEHHARALKKRLITFDTRSGDVAEPFYLSLGYQITGRVPDFGLDPDGKSYHATTYMHKLLE